MKTYDIVIVSGPSCVGKTPLVSALEKFHPKLANTLQPIIIYNSRPARPKEKDGEDYHFRSKSEIEQLREQDNFIVCDVRGDLQAVDIDKVSEMSKKSKLLFEGNPVIAKLLLEDSRLRDRCLSIFISPLSKSEFEMLEVSRADVVDTICEIMRRKLLRRTKKQKGLLSAVDLKEIEIRAQSAVTELREARHFQYVIPNHDGEDSENWESFGLLFGDARKTLMAFTCLLNLEFPPDWVERWCASPHGL